MMRSKMIPMTLLLVVTVIVVLGAGVSSALAAGEAHPFLREFGRTATEVFSNPNGVAIDEATGDVYVADIGTDTVYKFNANGEPEEFVALHSQALTGAATEAGSFSFPSLYGSPAAIAVDNACVQHTPALTGRACEEFDPSAGDLYVMDAGHGVIDKFNPEGKYLSQIGGFTPSTGSAGDELLGLGVDGSGTVHVDLGVGLSTEGKELLIDEFDGSTVNRLIAHQELHSQNQASGTSGIPTPTSLNEDYEAHGFAVSATGEDYQIFELSCSCTVKFGQKLSPLGRVDSGEAGDVAVAVDPTTGHLYADDQSSVAEWDTGAMNRNSLNGKSVGTLVSRFGSVELSGASGEGGIAVDGVTGDVYVSNPANGKVFVFASDAPAVTVGEPMGVTREGASLSGTVDPRGVPVGSCEFEYGLTDEFGNGPYDHSVPCAQTPGEIGAGSGPVAVSAQLEGLVPGELYHFRLVASNANGAGEGSGMLATQGVGFGIKSFEVSFLNEDGTPDTQAGSHPYQFVNTFVLNSHFKRQESNADSPYIRLPDGVLRDLKIDLPPGFVGDPDAPSQRCTGQQLELEFGDQDCPPESIVGELHLRWSENQQRQASLQDFLFAMPSVRGVALQLGTNFFLPLLYINNGVLAGGNYPVQATVTEAPTQAPIFSSRTVLPGVLAPCVKVGLGSGKYEAGCIETETAGVVGGEYEREPGKGKAFLTLPTGCHGPLRSTMTADSWEEPNNWAKASTVTRNAAGTPVSLTGCSKLKFPPTITASPDTTDASTSSGLTVGVHVPQTAAFNPAGLAESSLRDTTVTLPEGVAINPAGADGLEACSEGLAGFEGFTEFNSEYEPGNKTPTFSPTPLEQLQPGVSFCPNGSKIGTVKIKTPLLEHELEGSVYLAAQSSNPFGSLVAMYLMVEDPFSGSTIKLTGEVSLNPQTGQIVTTFKNTPDLPFENLELHFFGGERAPLTTPSRCGTYTTEATFVPWDGNGPVNASSSFQIEHGPNGSPCPGTSLPFNPSLTAGMTSVQAGGFSPFTMTMSREDGQQNLQAISLSMPSGLSGLLSGVRLCGEAEANAGTCGPESEIGETIVSVGVGNDPFSVKGGKVYITGPYKGAPFGLSIVNPAVAGPYNLGQVIVRAKIEVNPITAALTITSDNEGPYKIPQYIDGIPLQIKHVNVTITRPGFTFNPTNCTKTEIGGSLHSTEGATDTLSVPFQATNCATLGFAPKFAVSTSGKTSKANGASLNVKLTYPSTPFGSQANIARVKVDLPKQLPSRLTTLQKACTAAQFNTNPAGCPAASFIGHAKAITPLLPVPLEGPAIFVSHGGEAFPSLIVVLQGYGVTIDLVGSTFISKAGITSSTFKTVPDAPVGSFELTLPEGKYSALAANGNLCTSKLAMPTEFLAQNGAKINESTPIGITGCAKAKALTRAQKLAKALKACNRKAKNKRPACRASARKRYGPPAKKKTKGKRKARS
jgi:hypothetical protein